MPQNDIIEGQIVDPETPKKLRLALPKSKTAYAIYGAGALLVVGGVVAAIFASKDDDSTDTDVASDTETTDN